jgi:hypothetical protein
MKLAMMILDVLPKIVEKAFCSLQRGAASQKRAMRMRRNVTSSAMNPLNTTRFARSLPQISLITSVTTKVTQ